MAFSIRLALFVSIFMINYCAAARVNYEGYHVLQIKKVLNVRQADFIYKILDRDTRIRKVFLLEDDVLAGHPATLVVRPDLVQAVISGLRRQDLVVDVVNTNLQQSMDQNEAENDAARARWVARRAAGGPMAAPDVYLHYDEIEQYLQDVAAAHPGITTLFDVGPTFEGQIIRGIKIDTGGGSKPSIWLDSGIHAREWIAPATNLYILDQLLNGIGLDAAHLRGGYVWYIIPVVNPDGYRYTYSDPGDRMWRKTRSVYAENPNCVGTDGNRNWNHTAWGMGSADVPCFDTYHGPTPFSEQEVLGCANYILSDPNIVMTIHMHAYQQLWLHAYGYTGTPSDNNDNIVAVAEAACRGAEAVNGLQFAATSPADYFGDSGGSVMDWVYDTAGITYTYGPELRPKSQAQGGFDIPPSNIEPSGREIFNAIYSSVMEYESITSGRK